MPGKRLVALVAVAAFVVGLAMAAPARAEESSVDCPAGWICLWDQTNFTGTEITLQSALGECTELFYPGSPNTTFYAKSIIDNTSRTQTTLWQATLGILPLCILPSNPALVLSLGGSAANIQPYATAILTT